MSSSRHSTPSGYPPPPLGARRSESQDRQFSMLHSPRSATPVTGFSVGSGPGDGSPAPSNQRWSPSSYPQSPTAVRPRSSGGASPARSSSHERLPSQSISSYFDTGAFHETLKQLGVDYRPQTPSSNTTRDPGAAPRHSRSRTPSGGASPAPFSAGLSRRGSLSQHDSLSYNSDDLEFIPEAWKRAATQWTAAEEAAMRQLLRPNSHPPLQQDASSVTHMVAPLSEAPYTTTYAQQHHFPTPLPGYQNSLYEDYYAQGGSAGPFSGQYYGGNQDPNQTLRRSAYYSLAKFTPTPRHQKTRDNLPDSLEKLSISEIKD